MAPEIFGDEPDSFAVDVYAFGMLMYELFSSVAPFPDISNPLALGIRITQGERPPITAAIPPPFAQLIERCWVGDPAARPPFEAIVEELWSDGFDIPGADHGEVTDYRSRVFPPRTVADSPLARQRAELERLQADHRAAVDALLAEIAAIQDDSAKLCTLYRKLASKAQSLEREAALQDASLAAIGARVEQAQAEMEAVNAAYDGPLRAQLAADAARMEAAVAGAIEGTGMRRTKSAGRTEGVFAAAAQALRSRDVCAAGFVAVVGSSCGEEDAANIGRIPDASWDGMWQAADGGFVEFDFRGKRVALSGYAIRVAPGGKRSDLRSWAVQGWRDGEWIEIDRKEGDEQIGPDRAWVTFAGGRGRGEFAKVRIVQTGPASGGPGAGFALRNVEFFGVLKDGDGK
jgi:hypothetical protein